MSYKVCRICKNCLPITEFSKRTKSKDGLQSCCKICNTNQSKRYYHANRQTCLKTYSARAVRRQESLKKVLSEVKSLAGCCFCGEKDSCCLDFHHINDKDKTFEVNAGRNRSVDNFVKEALKCEVVCANCHRKIHAGKLIVGPRRLIDLTPLLEYGKINLKRKGKQKVIDGGVADWNATAF